MDLKVSSAKWRPFCIDLNVSMPPSMIILYLRSSCFHVSNSAYILQSIVLFSFYIEVVLTLSNRHGSCNYKNTPRAQIPTMPNLRSVNQAWNSPAKSPQHEKKSWAQKVINIPSFKQQLPLVSFPTYPEIDPFIVMLLADSPLSTSSTHTRTQTANKKWNKVNK